MTHLNIQEKVVLWAAIGILAAGVITYLRKNNAGTSPSKEGIKPTKKTQIIF